MNFQELTKTAVGIQKPATGYQLAKFLGVPPITVYRWLHGKGCPNGQNVVKLIEITTKKNQKGMATIALLLAIVAIGAVSEVALQLQYDLSNHYTKFNTHTL